jgi:hypothetical protein
LLKKLENAPRNRAIGGALAGRKRESLRNVRGSGSEQIK